MLKIKHVFKEYNNQEVLKDINITLPSKGLISIVGVSGSGKSTLLNLIGGIDKPSKGSIFINNVDVTKLNHKELNWYHNKYVGFIFQSYNLIEYLSVKDNLSLINSNYDYLLKKLNIYNYRKIRRRSIRMTRRKSQGNNIASNNQRLILNLIMSNDKSRES